MTSRKPASAPEPKPFDATQCSLPGRNVARFFRPAELSPRKSRELDVYEMTLMPKIRQLAVAQRIVGPDGETLAEDDALGGMVVGLSLDESRQLFEMMDTSVWVYLKSWTLKDGNGMPLPLPVSPDALLDLQPEIYKALVAHASAITQEQMTKPAPFSVDSIEDPDSPTGA